MVEVSGRVPALHDCLMRRTAFLRKPPDADRLTVKLKKCKVCRTQFVPRSGLQVACGIECAQALAKAKREKEEEAAAREERRADRAKREKLKTRSDWMKEAQRAFNAYRREWCRVNGYNACVCCDEPLDWSGNGVDAGHYRSVGSSPATRFVEANVWAQRKQCNRYGAGRAVDYRIGLIRRIGLEAVEALEADNEPRKYGIEELKVIKATYQSKLRELRKAYL